MLLDCLQSIREGRSSGCQNVADIDWDELAIQIDHDCKEYDKWLESDDYKEWLASRERAQP